jgi:hypothetical protein
MGGARQREGLICGWPVALWSSSSCFFGMRSAGAARAAVPPCTLCMRHPISPPHLKRGTNKLSKLQTLLLCCRPHDRNKTQVLFGSKTEIQLGGTEEASNYSKCRM